MSAVKLEKPFRIRKRRATGQRKKIKKDTKKDTTKLDVAIGKKIREVRVLSGFTREDLSKKLKVSQQQLHKYERGVNRITVSRLSEIAKTLKVNLADLILEAPINVIPDEASEPRKIHMDILHYSTLIKDHEKLQGVKIIVKALAGIYSDDDNTIF